MKPSGSRISKFSRVAIKLESFPREGRSRVAKGSSKPGKHHKERPRSHHCLSQQQSPRSTCLTHRGSGLALSRCELAREWRTQEKQNQSTPSPLLSHKAMHSLHGNIDNNVPPKDREELHNSDESESDEESDNVDQMIAAIAAPQDQPLGDAQVVAEPVPFEPDAGDNFIVESTASFDDGITIVAFNVKGCWRSC